MFRLNDMNETNKHPVCSINCFTNGVQFSGLVKQKGVNCPKWSLCANIFNFYSDVSTVRQVIQTQSQDVTSQNAPIIDKIFMREKISWNLMFLLHFHLFCFFSLSFPHPILHFISFHTPNLTFRSLMTYICVVPHR